MSQPITGGDVADILTSLGRSDAAATVRWGDVDPGVRHLSEVDALRLEVAELRAELQHATEDADRAWDSMCKRCRGKRHS